MYNTTSSNSPVIAQADGELQGAPILDGMALRSQNVRQPLGATTARQMYWYLWSRDETLAVVQAQDPSGMVPPAPRHDTPWSGTCRSQMESGPLESGLTPPPGPG